MCGIAGIWGTRNKGDEKLVRHLLHEISYRGPDDLKLLSLIAPDESRGATIGAVRLAIVDPENGQQPVVVAGGTQALVLSGEIYNHRAINAQLTRAGHHFYSDCDTETLAHLYQEYGAGFPAMATGMFAALAYNAKTDEFIAARDPFGIKPLYYVTDPQGRTIFCSEIRPLQNLAATKGEVRVIEPGTLWRNGTSKKYYRPHIGKPPSHKKLRESLIRTVESHLPPESDRPTGIYLSGGLDSGLIASIAAQKRKNIIAFTASTEAGGSDAEPALHLAKQLGLPCKLVVMKPQEMADALPSVITHLETFDYFQVLCALPFWFLSKTAKENGLKVVLSGEGSDELFAGYKYHQDWARQCAPYLFTGALPLKENKQSIMEMGMRTSLSRFLCSSELQRGDRMTAAFGLELRVPYLDTAFANLAMSVPIENKVPYAHKDDDRNKLFLREAFKGYVPDCVVESPKTPILTSSGADEDKGGPSFLALARQKWKDLSPHTSLQTRFGLQYDLEAYFLTLWKQSFGPFAGYLENLIAKGERPNPALMFPGVYIDPVAADNFGPVATKTGPVKPAFAQTFKKAPPFDKIRCGWSSLPAPT